MEADAEESRAKRLRKAHCEERLAIRTGVLGTAICLPSTA